LAVQNSPDLKSLEHKLNAAYAAARQQGRWANPDLRQQSMAANKILVFDNQ
jgi:hypothetical protein